MANESYALGLDYGTNSVRALIVNTQTGEEIGTGVFDYPSGENGIILDPKNPNLARQYPGDYLEGFYQSVSIAIEDASKDKRFSADKIVGIGVDTTASTPIPLDSECVPLALLHAFRDNPNAQAWLWKDHTSIKEADEITQKAKDFPYLPKVGGAYSSEWFWAKILRCSRIDPEVFNYTETWVELCDFIPAYLTGVNKPENIKRSACAAGHKALWSLQWGGLPSDEFLSQISDNLVSLKKKLYKEVFSIDQTAGYLSKQVAERSGLPAGSPVAIGAIDAHMGAVGAGIKQGMVVKIMGTSSCDIIVSPKTQNFPDIPGISGIAEDSVIPGMYGLEAGQAAVGDLFNWCATKLSDGNHELLQAEAQKLKPGESGLLALDWNNGNRNILANHELSGLLVGQTLSTTASEIYRALVEATAFGALRIIQRLEEYGVKVDELVICGGIAEKSPFIMQVYADALNRTIKLSRSGQTCALGSAISGAVVGGKYPDIPSAQQAMCGYKPEIYSPNPKSVEIYKSLYELFLQLHDAFGGLNSKIDLSALMHSLREIQKMNQ